MQMKVQNLLTNDDTWNVEVVRSLFSHYEAEAITDISILLSFSGLVETDLEA